MRLAVVGVLLLLLCAACRAAFGISVLPEEQRAARNWAAAMFQGANDSTVPGDGLEVVRNWGRVQKNARYGQPLTIAGKSYARGLFCHAPSTVTVRLPGPGKTFEAVLGADDALQSDVRDYPSGPLWPQLTFVVKADGKELFKSKALSGNTVGSGMPGLAISVDLAGASEFTIEVSNDPRVEKPKKNAGDKPLAPQTSDWGDADWADAKVTLQDGKTIFLDDLPMPLEMARPDPRVPPFSFSYGGQRSASLLDSWKLERSSTKLDRSRTQRTLTYTDRKTGLVVRCVGVEYLDYPTVEWTMYLKNMGSNDTPLIENLNPLDTRFKRGPDSEFLLHHSLGSSCRIDDYRPLESQLPPKAAKRFAPLTGYSSDPVMPYFNVESGSGEGVIVVVGWPGQWAAQFVRDGTDGLRVSAGQQTTRFSLHPGEEVRSPLIVMQFWRGDWIRSQNIWRRWMLVHNVPKPGGKPLPTMLSAMNCSTYGYTGMTEESQRLYIDRFVQEVYKLDWWWVDYGWEEDMPPGVFEHGQLSKLWKPDKKRFPNGVRAVADYAKKRGMKTIVWFAPEHNPPRAEDGGNPKWTLAGVCDEPLARGADVTVIDFGNPAAWKWLVDLIDARIASEGINCYRHDTVWGPLPAWKAHDTGDRQGITENHYVAGFLAFYDELVRRHPGLLIDNCCRGGRRNDLETMRRSVPLWRSDWTESVGQQSMTYGISLWLPFYGAGDESDNLFRIRSLMSPSTATLPDARNKNTDFASARRLLEQLRKLQPNMLGDFYPLTRYTTAAGTWIAWQFDRPENGQGMVQVFHRAGEPAGSLYAEAVNLKLQGLDAGSVYEVRNIDQPATSRMTGRDLMHKGIRVQAADGHLALVFTYKAAK
jgi:alpha-galactosidase